MLRLTVSQFIERARKIHNDKYDYSRVVYVNSYKKVEIVCPQHGSFFQVANSHLLGHECALCVDKNIKWTTERFIHEATKVHGDRYDYSLSNYIDSYTKVEIVCRQHGPFLQNPKAHIQQSQNCPFCAGNKMTRDIFIEKANRIHFNRYDYSAVIYQSNETGVTIKCPIHGIFIQKPHDHLDGCGCPSCQISQGERVITAILLSMGIEFEYQKKFDECKNGRRLPFDFYFQLNKLKFLIEYDGVQHFQPIRKFGGKEAFEITKRRDAIKTAFAAANGLILIRIPYTEFDNIETILKTEIERHT